MKLNISLVAKINIVFVFSFLFFVIAFIFFHMKQEVETHKSIVKEYDKIVSYAHRNRFPKEKMVEYFKNLNFKVVNNPREVFDKPIKPIFRGMGLEVLIKDNISYLYVSAPHFRVLFMDNEKRFKKQYLHFIVFGVFLIFYIVIYILIIKNIKEKELLLESRQLFLRTVMHELKTPIAKGRIVSELLDDEKQKNRLSSIFDKLNFLINDFAKVEQVISKNINVSKGSYSLDTILENAINMLMLDEKNMSKMIDKRLVDEIKLAVDLDLISMAIKNLLDNGIKYSDNKKILIEQKADGIDFISTGEKLPKPLEEYFKPFHNETKSKNHGMGLGLYIVHSILEIHNMNLKYEYSDGKNIFKIVF
jgi:signal transduction histidine kinase